MIAVNTIPLLPVFPNVSIPIPKPLQTEGSAPAIPGLEAYPVCKYNPINHNKNVSGKVYNFSLYIII